MIHSAQNSLIKRIRRLRQKKYRQQESASFVEGIRVVLSAWEAAPHLVDVLVYAPDLLRSEPAEAALAQAAAAGIRVEPVTADLFGNISERDRPFGLGAIVRSPEISADRLPKSGNAIWIVLESVSDPGNLGTILRTADAAAVTGVILIGNRTDLLHPTALKASMGTAFTVPSAGFDTAADFLEWAKQEEVALLATTAKTHTPYWEMPNKRPMALCFGNEQLGLSTELLAAAAHTLTIPMRGQASSLNLAVAAGILIFETVRATS